jgi:hypothetical protein
MPESVQGLNALQRRLAAISGPKSGERIMRLIGTAAVRESKLLVARKTGNLGRSIHVEGVTETSAKLVAAESYAAYVEFGTRPHEITPNAKKALRFAASASGRRLTGSPRVGAAVVFAKRVHHPGTKAQPFLLPGAQKAVSQVGTSVIVKAWNDAS